MKAEPIETKAKGRFTEATLIRELEKHGIGRPSTFASLLATIQEKNYVEIRDIPPTTKQITEHTLSFNALPITTITKPKKVGAEKQKLVPTELGRSVLHFLLQHFDDLFAYDFTGQLEQRLDHVADGTENWKAVVRDTWTTYKERYELLNQKVQQGVSNKVKEFQDGVKAVQSKKGPLLLREGLTKDSTTFFGWPQGITWDQMTEEVAQAFIAQQQKPLESFGTWNNEPIERKTGKFGDYFKCGEISVPFKEEPLEETIQRLQAKSAGAIKQFKEYTVRSGQYGPYIMKTTVKKPQFISLPKGLDPTTLTEKDVEALYKAGLEQKKTAKKLK
jgi:DNA topoisomerase-1